MFMRPLPRQFLIGLIVSLCVVGALAATWWTAAHPDDSLASRLPADAVLAYAEFPKGDLPVLSIVTNIAPALSLPDEVAYDVTAAAAVRMQDGTEGWTTFWKDDHGVAHIGGTDPSLQALFDDPRPSLSSDRAFSALRFKTEQWAYIAFPDVTQDGSGFGKLFALDTPIAFALSASGTTMRFAVRPTPNIPAAPERPLATLAVVTHAVTLPPWKAMDRIGDVLSPEARTVAETLAATFLGSVAGGMSLHYEASGLLAGPSFFQSGIPSTGSGQAGGAAVFALEGTGRSAAETDRILRQLHDAFASSRGSARVKTLTAEGFTMRTIGQAEHGGTIETRDGTWTILTTVTDAGTLTSAQDGTRYAVTTDPGALTRTNAAPTGGWSRLTLTTGARLALQPLWPDMAAKSGVLRWKTASGPGYIEWTWTHADR